MAADRPSGADLDILGGGRPVLVLGLAATGAAVARYLAGSGVTVIAVDDRPGLGAQARADQLGLELVGGPSLSELAELAARSGLVIASPGVPARHPIFSLGVEVVSEVEVAGLVARARGLEMVAVTGTNGKTTVTTLVRRILAAAGRPAVAAGNIGTPLLEAVAGGTLAGGAGVVVAEVSSFQLALTRQFRPQVAVWLNLAPDHLDWHPSFGHYEAAKARIWANQGLGDTAVGNRDDPAVMARLAGAGAEHHVTFGLDRPGLDQPGLDQPGRDQPGFHVAGDWLVDPLGQRILSVGNLWRALPHDVANALAACAAAAAAGAEPVHCRAVLASFEGLAHRVELVGEAGGVRWYDDSKSTSPASVVAAVNGFDSVVLIAGGRNKGLDLSPLAGLSERLRAVVAMGEAAGELESVLGSWPGRPVPVTRAASMAEAVALAASWASAGDVVLLSPGCASFDWYDSFADRGRDFTRLVAHHLEACRVTR